MVRYSLWHLYCVVICFDIVRALYPFCHMFWYGIIYFEKVLAFWGLLHFVICFDLVLALWGPILCFHTYMHSGVPFFVFLHFHIFVDMVLTFWGPILCCHLFWYGSCTLDPICVVMCFNRVLALWGPILCPHLFWYIIMFWSGSCTLGSHNVAWYVLIWLLHFGDPFGFFICLLCFFHSF